MITYVITVSRKFPATHPRRGEQTGFVEGIIEKTKLHTIRSNYILWKKRFEKIDAGEACLSLRYWTGKPYCSKQQEFLRLTKEDGIGIQKVTMRQEIIQSSVFVAEKMTPIAYISRPEFETNLAPLSYISMNDGLQPDEFIDWFSPAFDKARKKYDFIALCSTAMEIEFAVIHFTKFRY